MVTYFRTEIAMSINCSFPPQSVLFAPQFFMKLFSSSKSNQILYVVMKNMVPDGNFCWHISYGSHFEIVSIESYTAGKIWIYLRSQFATLEAKWNCVTCMCVWWLTRIDIKYEKHWISLNWIDMIIKYRSTNIYLSFWWCALYHIYVVAGGHIHSSWTRFTSRASTALVKKSRTPLNCLGANRMFILRFSDSIGSFDRAVFPARHATIHPVRNHGAYFHTWNPARLWYARYEFHLLPHYF